MISRHTKVLFLVAIICLATAAIWQNHLQAIYARSHPNPDTYNLELQDGTWHLYGPDAHRPFVIKLLGFIGSIAFLLAVPLLVKDFADGRRHR